MDNDVDSLIIPDELLPFIEGMVKEYNRHKKIKGDTWKYCSLEKLYCLLSDSFNNATFDGIMRNSSHLFDIANFCWFLWFNKEEIDRGN